MYTLWRLICNQTKHKLQNNHKRLIHNQTNHKRLTYHNHLIHNQPNHKHPIHNQTNHKRQIHNQRTCKQTNHKRQTNHNPLITRNRPAQDTQLHPFRCLQTVLSRENRMVRVNRPICNQDALRECYSLHTVLHSLLVREWSKS